MSIGSKEVCTAAIRMSLTADRDEEHALKASLAERGVRACACDFGGEFIPSINKIMERAIVAARREGVVGDTHAEEGSIAGATREALAQIMPKAIGLNVGGKIGVARCQEHIAVSIYFGIGLLHLNENALGLGHRVI